MVRALAKQLSTLKKYHGAVIAEASFELGTFSESIEIVRERSSIAVVKVCDDNSMLIVKMMFPKSQTLMHPILSSNNLSWKQFTVDEVKNFVDEVGDNNEIHRGNNPVVPGLLILDILFNEFECKKITVRFNKFIYAGDNLNLTIDGDNFFVDNGIEREITGCKFEK